MENEDYMNRCIELAAIGLGYTAPNPMVGSVIIYNHSVIGEGYHQALGGPHAEVNAINSVEDKSLLAQSTLYVNLEPCSHHGKTPPCADLIIKYNIPKVVIGTVDPFIKVAGRGIEKLKQAGIEVVVGVLAKECKALNKRFFNYHIRHQPYIILKWAQTDDGYIAHSNQNRGESLQITNHKTNQLVHQWRAQEQAILVGKTTVLKDDPQLNVRLVTGKNPIPIIFAQKQDIPSNYRIHNHNPVFISHPVNPFDELNTYCVNHGIQSILVEGGSKTLQTFIDANFWNEARIITNTTMQIGHGIAAPHLSVKPTDRYRIENDQIEIFYNTPYND